jgi:hypothetical protein
VDEWVVKKVEHTAVKRVDDWVVKRVMFDMQYNLRTIGKSQVQRLVYKICTCHHIPNKVDDSEVVKVEWEVDDSEVVKVEWEVATAAALHKTLRIDHHGL